jgi:hypothetical protein
MVKDTTILGFGKYRHLTPDEIAETDPSYIVWMYDNVRPRRCSKSLRDACEHDIVDDDGYMNPMCDQD